MAKKRFRFRPPGLKPTTKIGTLGPYRGRLGLAWVIAPIVVGAMILIAGYLVLAPVTLEAYCWPPSAVRGEPVGLRVSTDASSFDVVVAREGAASEPVWSAEAGRRHDRTKRPPTPPRTAVAGPRRSRSPSATGAPVTTRSR